MGIIQNYGYNLKLLNIQKNQRNVSHSKVKKIIKDASREMTMLLKL